MEIAMGVYLATRRVDYILFFSKTFDEEQSNDTSLLLLNISSSSHLKRGMTLTIFILAVKTLST